MITRSYEPVRRPGGYWAVEEQVDGTATHIIATNLGKVQAEVLAGEFHRAIKAFCQDNKLTGRESVHDTISVDKLSKRSHGGPVKRSASSAGR